MAARTKKKTTEEATSTPNTTEVETQTEKKSNTKKTTKDIPMQVPEEFYIVDTDTYNTGLEYIRHIISRLITEDIKDKEQAESLTKRLNTALDRYKDQDNENGYFKVNLALFNLKEVNIPIVKIHGTLEALEK